MFYKAYRHTLFNASFPTGGLNYQEQILTSFISHLTDILVDFMFFMFGAHDAAL